MPKKSISFILLILCMLLFTGCNKVMDLTDEETRLIAEYAADALLKYDKNYLNRMEEGSSEVVEENLEKITTSEETTTEELAEVVTTEKDTAEESSEGQNVDNKIDDEVADTKATDNGSQDIGELLALDNVSIKYQDYLITEQYPAKDKDGELIYLNASDGYKLLVIRFNVKNLADDVTDLSLLDKEAEYTILCNGNKAANPMLTILLDDLETLEVSLQASEETGAVLVFQISDNMKDQLETIELKVRYNEKDNGITILE